MFDQFLDNVRKATETNVQLQQELLKRWAALWPGLPGVPAGSGLVRLPPKAPPLASGDAAVPPGWLQLASGST